MAYAATVRVNPAGYDRGRPMFTVTVTEVEASSTSEWSTASAVDDSGRSVTLPREFTIVRQKVDKTAGTAATVAPVLAKATGITAAGPNSLSTQTAAASIDDAARYACRLTSSRILYGRNTPNTGSDNSITTEILIVQGWDA